MGFVRRGREGWEANACQAQTQPGQSREMGLSTDTNGAGHALKRRRCELG